MNKDLICCETFYSDLIIPLAFGVISHLLTVFTLCIKYWMTGLRSDCGLQSLCKSGHEVILTLFACLWTIGTIEQRYTHEVWLSSEKPSTRGSEDAGPRKAVAWYWTPRWITPIPASSSTSPNPVWVPNEPRIITSHRFLVKLIWFWIAGFQAHSWMNRLVFPSLKILSPPFKCSLAAGEEC